MFNLRPQGALRKNLCKIENCDKNDITGATVRSRSNFLQYTTDTVICQDTSPIIPRQQHLLFKEKDVNRDMKIEELKEGIRNISEPRRTGYGNIRHKLEDIIIIGLCTIICGGEDFADMEAFGKS